MRRLSFIFIALLCLVALFLLKKSCSRSTNNSTLATDQTDTIPKPVIIYKEVKKERPKLNPPPLEVFVLDQETIPTPQYRPNTTYTASIYIINNNKRKVFGPYRGSSFPNAREKPIGSDKPNTIITGAHLFNNLAGHNTSTQKGLNIVNADGKRENPGFSWTKKPKTMEYVNVHSGATDNGTKISRGSEGCVTLHPKDVAMFFSHFDFTGNARKTIGNSSGTLLISRTDMSTRKMLISDLLKIYPDE